MKEKSPSPEMNEKIMLIGCKGCSGPLPNFNNIPLSYTQ